MVSYWKKYQTSTREQHCPNIAPAKQISASKSPQPWWWNLAGCWGAASASQPSADYSDLGCPPQLCMDARHEHWWQKREANPRSNSWGNCYASPTWNTAQMSMCGACDACGSNGVFMPLSNYGSWYGLARWHGTIAYANYQAGRAPSIAFVGRGDNVRVVPTTP